MDKEWDEAVKSLKGGATATNVLDVLDMRAKPGFEVIEKDLRGAKLEPVVACQAYDGLVERMREDVLKEERLRKVRDDLMFCDEGDTLLLRGVDLYGGCNVRILKEPLSKELLGEEQTWMQYAVEHIDEFRPPCLEELLAIAKKMYEHKMSQTCMAFAEMLPNRVELASEIEFKLGESSWNAQGYSGELRGLIGSPLEQTTTKNFIGAPYNDYLFKEELYLPGENQGKVVWMKVKPFFVMVTIHDGIYFHRKVYQFELGSRPWEDRTLLGPDTCNKRDDSIGIKIEHS